MKITDKEIATTAGRSPQVISAMKKSYPNQYEVLKVGTYAILNKLVASKSFSDMSKEELFEEHEHALQRATQALVDIEVIADFYKDSSEIFTNKEDLISYLSEKDD